MAAIAAAMAADRPFPALLARRSRKTIAFPLRKTSGVFPNQKGRMMLS
jgi:hypothetical protein